MLLLLLLLLMMMMMMMMMMVSTYLQMSVNWTSLQNCLRKPDVTSTVDYLLKLMLSHSQCLLLTPDPGSAWKVDRLVPDFIDKIQSSDFQSIIYRFLDSTVRVWQTKSLKLK